MKPIFIDFETFYDEKQKYSLKNMTVQSYIKDPRFKVLGMSVSAQGTKTIWIDGHDNCQAFFNRLPKDVIFVAHNATFDAAVAYRVFGFKANKYICTMFMARYLISQNVLPPKTHTALKDIAPFVDEEKLHLDEALANGTLDTYAIKDTDICKAFYEKYIDQIPQDEQQYIDMHVKASSIPQFALDTEQLTEVAAVDEDRKKWYGHVRKDDILVKILQSRGVDVEYKEMKLGKKPCFSKTDDFMDYLVNHKDPIVRYMAQLRLEAKSTCAVSKAQRFLDCGSPMACPLIYYGAHTGRSSGTDNMNVQNMPRGSKVRTSLMAQKGKKLIIIDSSQIEVRTLGFLAGDESILSVFRRGGDIYREFAGNQMYNKAPEDVTKDERQIAKAAVLALGFGQGVQGFIRYAQRMGIMIDEAQSQHAVSVYRRSFPKITGGFKFGGYWAQVENFVLNHGYSELPTGRRIYYLNLRHEGDKLVFDRADIFNKAGASSFLWHGLMVENLVQACARDIIFSQVATVLNRYPQADLCLMVHDESIFSVPEEDAEEIYKFTDETFKTPPAWAANMPVNGEGHISDRYDK